MDSLQDEVSRNPWAAPMHEIPSITLNDTNVIFKGDAYRLEYFTGSASDDNAPEGHTQWNSGSETDVDSLRTGRSRSIRRSATVMDANRTNFSHDSGFGVVASRRSRSRSESPPPDPYAHIAVYPQRFLFNFDDPRHDVEHTFDRELVRQAWTDREWNKQAREMMDALKLVMDKPAEIDDDFNSDDDVDDVDDDEYRVRKDKRARKTTDEILRKYAASAHARLKRQQEERWATCVDILYAIEAFDRGIMSKSFALRTLFGLMQQNGVDACTPDCPCRCITVPPPASVSQAEYDCAFKSTASAVPDPHPNLPFEHPTWDPVLSLCQTIGEYTDQAVAAARNYATRFVTACRRAKATYDEELIHRHWRRTRRVVAQEVEEWDQYGVRHTYHMAYLPF